MRRRKKQVEDAVERAMGRASDMRENVRDTVDSVRGNVRETVDTVRDNVRGTVDSVKPKLRGWLHLGTFPASIVAGFVLVAFSPTLEARVATAVFAMTAILLFGVSATYHRGSWGPRAHAVLKRLDHSNIFLIIAGTYTPFATLLLDNAGGRTLLWLVWAGALVGVLFRVFWSDAPRWLYTPVYVALGWVAVFYLPEILRHGGVAVLVLLLVGGLFYTVGGIVYAAKRPDPSPRWFGFHEVFHAFTLVAFVVHYIAVSFVAYSAG
ncbi:PAQR family membrane homeostasis protein TrhA [Motilibacter deserti]